MNFIYKIDLNKEFIDIYEIKEELKTEFSINSVEKNIDDFKINEYIKNYIYDKTVFSKTIEKKYNIRIKEVREEQVIIDLSGIIPAKIFNEFSNLNEEEQSKYIDVISKSWKEIILPELKHKLDSFPKLNNEYIIEKIKEDDFLSIQDTEIEYGFEF